MSRLCGCGRLLRGDAPECVRCDIESERRYRSSLAEERALEAIDREPVLGVRGWEWDDDQPAECERCGRPSGLPICALCRPYVRSGDWIGDEP